MVARNYEMGKDGKCTVRIIMLQRTTRGKDEGAMNTAREEMSHALSTASIKAQRGS